MSSAARRPRAPKRPCGWSQTTVPGVVRNTSASTPTSGSAGVVRESNGPAPARRAARSLPGRRLAPSWPPRAASARLTLPSRATPRPRAPPPPSRPPRPAEGAPRSSCPALGGPDPPLRGMHHERVTCLDAEPAHVLYEAVYPVGEIGHGLPSPPQNGSAGHQPLEGVVGDVS